MIFSDNDTSFKYISYKLGTYFVFPLFFNSDRVIEKFSVSSEKIYKYGGYKEDIYIAQYEPNPNFLDGMPFDNFITIRPENLKASYVPKNAKTIVPELFDLFRNGNILYLPRYSYEKKYADGYSNIYIPSGPLNGLDVCYYTKAMLTGAGSFAREAAIMGKPSISFFPGKTWLSVDKAMQDNGWEYASRNPLDIYNYVNSGKIERGIRHNSKKTFDEVVEILNNIIRKHNK